jgi:hypothetical protein
LESQHVKALTEGYLRGWLNFKYTLKTSRIREGLILNYIEEERLYSLLQNKLFIDAAVLSSLPHKTRETLAPIYEINKSLIELKLPLLTPKDKIKDNNNDKALSKEEIAEWKAFFDDAKKNRSSK